MRESLRLGAFFPRLSRVKRQLAIVDPCADPASNGGQHFNHECASISVKPLKRYIVAVVTAVVDRGFHLCLMPLNTQLSTLSFFTRLLDYVPYIESGRTASISLLDHAVSHSANFFGGLLGANIIFADKENHVLNKLEGMIQH